MLVPLNESFEGRTSLRRLWSKWARNEVQMVQTISWIIKVDSPRFFRGDAVHSGLNLGLVNVRTRCSGESSDGSSFCSLFLLLGLILQATCGDGLLLYSGRCVADAAP